MSVKIYTKTGDAGKTSLIGGTKVSKHNIRIESYGTVDELNSFVGLVTDLAEDQNSKNHLKEIQNKLFVIGSILACDSEKNIKMPLPEIREEDVTVLEKEIDKMDAQLPVMKNFILPGGHITVSTIHIARCVCRRAERNCVALHDNRFNINPIIIIYLNRLSDYLFVLARYTAHILHVPEIIWKGK